MLSETFVFVAAGLAVGGGALGARFAGAAWWQGALIGAAGFVASSLAGMALGGAGLFWPFIATLAGMAAAGAAMKLQSRQIAETAAAALVCSLVGGAVYAAADEAGLAPSGRLTCDGLVAEIVTIDQGPLAPKLLDVVETETVRQTDDRLECKGLGLFSDRSREAVRYRTYEEFGKRWIEFEPAG
ncbi:hypothetical protein L0F51_03840 [Afifella sp. H1R]|uniref:hypothetical protein n=1 Tax=Afifella sp. H1R TaxID=2908841 RepID=UPI001F280ABB|nr:hypothetical protein [Afifella sp. H1R]MCF1502897.1 hypothetical protein [Afifella sp. H1R]